MAAIKKKSGRQAALTAIVPFDYTMFNCATTVADIQKAIELPKGAVVKDGWIVIDTAFNSATSDTMTVGDETVTNRYKAGINAQATGLTALVPTAFKSTGVLNVVIGLTPVGATMPTTGAGRLMITYYIDGRSQTDQG